MQPNRRVLIVNCFETYEHRADLLDAYFRGQGCQVTIITSDWLHMNKTVRQTCPQNYEMLHVKPYYKNLSPQRLISHHGFAQAAFEKMEEFRPDLLWVFVPPNSLAKFSARYKKAHPEVMLVMDFIDMWPETMPIPLFKGLPPFSNWRNLRDDYVRYADAVVTECALYQTILGKKCAPERMHTLYLARKSQGAVSKPRLPEDRIALCYLGSINNIIDIPCIAEIIRSIDGKVDLHIIGDGEKRRELVDEATKAGANVIFHGKIYDPQEMQAIFDQCHFGLNIMKESVFVGLTMKSVDYFKYGIPIINNIKGDTWKFVETRKIGVNVFAGQSISRETVDRSNRCRGNVRAFFLEHFTEDEFGKRVSEILGDMEGRRDVPKGECYGDDKCG